MHLFKWLAPKRSSRGLVMRISTADQVDYTTIMDPSDSGYLGCLGATPSILR